MAEADALGGRVSPDAGVHVEAGAGGRLADEGSAGSVRSGGSGTVHGAAGGAPDAVGRQGMGGDGARSGAPARQRHPGARDARAHGVPDEASSSRLAAGVSAGSNATLGAGVSPAPVAESGAHLTRRHKPLR